MLDGSTPAHPEAPLMPDQPDTPTDPFTELAAAAHQLHELYLAQVDAGFTDRQAMQIVCAVLTGGMGGDRS